MGMEHGDGASDDAVSLVAPSLGTHGLHSSTREDPFPVKADPFPAPKDPFPQSLDPFPVNADGDTAQHNLPDDNSEAPHKIYDPDADTGVEQDQILTDCASNPCENKGRYVPQRKDRSDPQLIMRWLRCLVAISSPPLAARLFSVSA